MRRFTIGSRATLLLARSGDRSGERSGDRSRAESSPGVLLKVFDAGTSVSSIDVELTALCSSDVPHIVRLLDVATIVPGEPPCLVLEKLAGPTLLALLDGEASISPGQAVTILAPLCAALQSLHDAGVTHGAIHPRRVVFDHLGAPVLTGFGRGAVRDSARHHVGSSAPRPASPSVESSRSRREDAWRRAVLSDQRDFLTLVTQVLARVDIAERGSAVDVSNLASGIGLGPSREFLARLEAVLFETAIPEPMTRWNEVTAAVASVTVSSAAGAVRPAAMGTVPRGTAPVAAAMRRGIEAAPDSETFDWATPSPAANHVPAENRLVSALRILGAPSGVLETAGSLAQLRSRFVRQHPPGTPSEAQTPRSAKRFPRKLLIAGAVCAAAAMTTLLLVLPTGTGGISAGASPGERPTNTAPADPASDVTVEATPEEVARLTGDDPADALRALARVHNSCVMGQGQDCADAAFQSDENEATADTTTSMTIDAADALVTGRWGGSALVSASVNGRPASLLLVKGEAGWRIRDVFDEGQ